MKTLITEDDFTSRVLLNELLKGYGPVHVAVNGEEAVEAVRRSLQDGAPYHLICLDIMMPKMDGQTALKAIRDLERDAGVFSTNGAKIVMITALGDMKNVTSAFSGLADSYLTKPLDKKKLLATLQQLGLLT